MSSCETSLRGSNNSVTCVTFFLRKPGTDIYSPQALWSSSSEKKNGCRSRFCVLAEKENQKSLTNKKISSVNALKAIFLPLKLSK